MRCTKCGFISFDHLSSCAKCGRDISEVASELQGTSIKVETPMFLSGALAAFSESGQSFDEHAMGEVDEGIDFHMETEEPAIGMAAEEDVDFSFEEEAEEIKSVGAPGLSLAEAEAEEAAGIEEEAEETFDLGFESAEAKEESVLAETEDSFDELDLNGVAFDNKEEGGLEFDLEDFMEEVDDDKTKASANDDVSDIDLDFGDEEK